MALYDYNVGSPAIISGRYSLQLKNSWGHWIAESSYYTGFMGLSIGGYVNYYDIKTYDELKEISMYISFNGSNVYNLRTDFTLSRPKIQVRMKQNLEDADVFAQVVPKSIFTTPKDTFAIGTNCKIAFHPKSWIDNTYDKNDTIMISDDSSRQFGALTLDADSMFDTFYKTPSGETATGFLAVGVASPNDLGKIYPGENKSEYMLSPNNLPAFGDTLATGYPHNKFDIGRVLIENDLCYFWVDQANNLIKSIDKNNVDVGNPVSVIQSMLNTYYDTVEIDTAAFTTAIALRKSYRMRMLVSSEQRLINLIDQISKEFGLLTFEDNLGRMSIITLDPPLTTTRDITDDEIVYVKKLPAFTEEFTDIEYLITLLDVYYNYINNDYKGYIESSDLGNQDYLIEASSYVVNDIKVRLNLKTVFNIETANLCANVKMLYHKSPTRIVKLETTMSASDIHVGQWVTCSSSSIPELSNKIFLVVKDSCQVPFKSKYRKFVDCYEFNLSDFDNVIREVPDQSVNTNYDELPDTAIDYEEVPDV